MKAVGNFRLFVSGYYLRYAINQVAIDPAATYRVVPSAEYIYLVNKRKDGKRALASLAAIRVSLQRGGGGHYHNTSMVRLS